MQPDVKILSLKEVDKIFDGLLLTNKEGAGIKRAVLRDSLRGIIKDAKANLQSSGHIKTGNLLKSLGVITKVRKGTAYAAAGARNPKGSDLEIALTNHFHLVNSGTDNRTTATGANRGSVDPVGFFDSAVISNMSRIPEAMQASFEKRMAAFMAKKY